MATEFSHNPKTVSCQVSPVLPPLCPHPSDQTDIPWASRFRRESVCYWASSSVKIDAQETLRPDTKPQALEQD